MTSAASKKTRCRRAKPTASAAISNSAAPDGYGGASASKATASRSRWAWLKGAVAADCCGRRNPNRRAIAPAARTNAGIPQSRAVSTSNGGFNRMQFP